MFCGVHILNACCRKTTIRNSCSGSTALLANKQNSDVLEVLSVVTASKPDPSLSATPAPGSLSLRMDAQGLSIEADLEGEQRSLNLPEVSPGVILKFSIPNFREEPFTSVVKESSNLAWYKVYPRLPSGLSKYMELSGDRVEYAPGNVRQPINKPSLVLITRLRWIRELFIIPCGHWSRYYVRRITQW